MNRYDLTDFEWRVTELLPPNKPRGLPRLDEREVLGAPEHVTVMVGLRLQEDRHQDFIVNTVGLRSSAPSTLLLGQRDLSALPNWCIRSALVTNVDELEPILADVDEWADTSVCLLPRIDGTLREALGLRRA